MKRISASFLAASLAALAVPASAQVAHFQPYPDARGYPSEPGYDYARVVRVDPVFDRGHGGYDAGPRCYERPAYAGGDRHDRYGRDYYSGRSYPRDGGYHDPYGGHRGGTQAGATVATVVGGLVGAVIGSQIGGGSARYATSAIGTMAGGMVGREIYEQSQRERVGAVRVCEPVGTGGGYAVSNGGVYAYDVTYEYAGRQYTTRTDHHPGDRIRVRVDVRPD